MPVPLPFSFDSSERGMHGLESIPVTRTRSIFRVEKHSFTNTQDHLQIAMICQHRFSSEGSSPCLDDFIVTCNCSILDTLCMRIGNVETLRTLDKKLYVTHNLKWLQHSPTYLPPGIMICLIFDSKLPLGPCIPNPGMSFNTPSSKQHDGLLFSMSLIQPKQS